MKLQIQLNEKNPKEKKAADKIRSFGARSGVPRQVLVDAVLALDETPTAPPAATVESKKSAPDLSGLMG